MTTFRKLFEPGYIGNLMVKNRIIQAPMCTRFAAADGSVTARLTNYYKERAVGGTGLIIVEHAYIDKIASQSCACQLALCDESFVPGLSSLARVIQDNGARAGIQINHCGRQRFLARYPMVAPSRVPWEALGEIVPTELTVEEIRDIVKAFGNAARIAERAGFDMVEIHGAHGYLITEFLSPHTNKRQDIYGGNLQNRMRFALEVVDSVKSSVSRDFPVGVRVAGSEYLPDGITIDDSRALAVLLEKAGVDVIHVSGGIHEAGSFEIAPMLRPLALHRHLAKAIKEVVHIPVIASGSITTPQLAEDILENEDGDFISFARPLFADPWFAKKAEEGRVEDIVPCIRCNDGCLLRGSNLSRALTCTVNAEVGFEGEYNIEPAAKAKRIAVIGGGPGGMEAARVAALKGHNVTLYEMRNQLGGYLIEASVPGFKRDLVRLIEYLSGQLTKLGVKVILGTDATVQMLQQQGFDAVILATGSEPIVPDIRGVSGKSVVTAVDVLRGKRVGNDVLMAGGGFVGCEVALFLAQAGKRVQVIEVLDELASGMSKEEKQVIFEEFSKYGVGVNVGLRVDEIMTGGAVAVDRYGNRRDFKADTIVLALGFVPKDNLRSGLEETGIPVYSVGDCIKPRKIYDAIREGFFAAYKI